MEEDKKTELLIYFEDLALVRAEFFYYKHIANLKNPEIEKRLDKRSKTVGGYVTRSNHDFEDDLKLDPTDPEVHHIFLGLAPGIPPYGQWPPEGYEPIKRPIPPTEPPPEPPRVPPIKPPIEPPVPPIVPIVDEEPEPRRFGWVAIVLAGVIVLVVFAGITALIVDFVQDDVEVAITGGTDTPTPTSTSTPTETYTPTPTEDPGPLIALAQSRTAEALPTVDIVATGLVGTSAAQTATSDHLTANAPPPTDTPTSTPTFTPTPTDTPTSTPTATPTEVAYFRDEFNEENLDNEKWEAVGTLPLMLGDAIRIETKTGPLPYVYSLENPFPLSGDFTLEVRMRFVNVQHLNSGLQLDTLVPEYGTWDYNREHFFSIFQGSRETHHYWISLFGAYAYQATSSDIGWHTVQIQYSDNQYTVIQDGVALYQSEPTTKRPSIIWFGNPDFSDRTDWTSFEIDYIRVFEE